MQYIRRRILALKPTSPFRSPALLIESMKLLISDLQSTSPEAIHELLLQNSSPDSATLIRQQPFGREKVKALRARDAC